MGDPAAAARLPDEVVRLRAELHRLQHGKAIEGDHVCAAELWRANVEPLIEAVASLRWVVERHNTLDAPCLCSRCKLSDAIEKLATTAKEGK